MIYKLQDYLTNRGRKKNTNSIMLLATVLSLFFVSEVSLARDLTIAAFNVQIFGQKKANDAFVMETLVKIIQRYDIILIQEIRDSRETAIYKLQEKVNEASPSDPFDMTVSLRMGRSSSKEQYAFLYRRKSGLRVENVYVYDDGDESLNNKSAGIIVDTFEREPYIVHFSSTNTELKEFVLCGIHVAPEEAVHEIKALKEVFVDILQKFGINDIMVMGDLNADCSYVPKKSWAEISIRSDPSYHWLLDEEVDTTVSNTDCAYDRFIGKGDGFSTADTGGVVAGSPRVFNYKQEYGLTSEQALDVSDHYPIEFKLKGKGGKTTRLRSAHILNAHVLVPETGSSLRKDEQYFVEGINLHVVKEDGTVVAHMYDGTQKDSDECQALKALILGGLLKDRIRVEMLRTRSWKKRQLCKIIVKFTEDKRPKVKAVLNQYLKVYGNVIYL